MISVKEATNIVLAHTFPLKTTLVPLENAVGRILQENLYADRDFPPFNRVAMDGIAIQYADFEQGRRQFGIEGVCPAGTAQKTLQSSHNCLEVMTGCILPADTDTVIRYEDVSTQIGQAIINVDHLKNGQNIHRKGSDRKQNSLITKAGQRITSAEIGVAATVGKALLKVSKLPKYATLAEDFTFKPNLTLFQQVSTHFDKNGRFWASPIKGNGSGDLASLVDTDGFLVLPEGEELFEAGRSFRFLGYR